MAATPVHFDAVAPALDWLRARGATGLSTDSRRLQPGEAFIAWPGYAQDGRAYVGAALAAGAAACLVEAEGVEAFDFGGDDRVAALAQLKPRTGVLAAQWFGAPSRALDVLAVTGTNGKTSTTWWLAQALTALGPRCGVVGTLGIGVPPDAVEPTGLTTPDPVALQRAFRRFADAGHAACAIEASSIGIVEQRLAGTQVAVALFTNFTQDHLDYHGSMAAYWEAKRRLFAWDGLRAAVLNLDDAQGEGLAAQAHAAGLEVWTVSRRGAAARLRAEQIGYAQGGLVFTLVEGDERVAVTTGLIGDYNVENLLVVAGGLRALGQPLAAIGAALGGLLPVPGRMQRVPAPDAAPQVIVDYAHTPDALEQALRALQPFAAARGGVLWCVFGCGGNRDAAKRPLMGAIAQRLAQRVVIASDNPRHERPADILAQIEAGLVGARDGVETIADRRSAIGHAVRGAAPHDVVLIAGKGHEDYQEVAGVKQPFSDAAEARAALDAREARA